VPTFYRYNFVLPFERCFSSRLISQSPLGDSTLGATQRARVVYTMNGFSLYYNTCRRTGIWEICTNLVLLKTLRVDRNIHESHKATSFNLFTFIRRHIHSLSHSFVVTFKSSWTFIRHIHIFSDIIIWSLYSRSIMALSILSAGGFLQHPHSGAH
jgi:hypothetical protein